MAPEMRRLVPGDPGFPILPPNLDPSVEQLWIRGTPLEEFGICVAIVGTRRATPYGIEVARMLAADFASAGICVVSGMARGIDAAAHEGALSVGGPTMAVLASGVDVPSPASNRELYERLILDGAVISERPLGVDGLKHDYPVRNRIIVAMARAVIIVQGEIASGSGHSAKWAERLDRQLFAVPGDIRSPASALPHALLRDGAAPCTCVGDVLAFLDELPDRSAAPLPDDLEPDELSVLRVLSAGPSLGADAVARAAGLGALQASFALSALELRGFIARDMGSAYRRIR